MTLPYRAYRTRFLLFAATLLYLAPSTAMAAEAGCRVIVVEDGFRVRFPELFQDIRSVVLARTDTDSCARVELHLESTRILLSVTLPDGRAASRDVLRRDDIVPTLRALLVVPDAPTPPDAPLPSALPPRPAPPFSRVVRAEREVFPSPAIAERTLGFEFSLMSSVRLGDGQYGYGLGALSFLEVGGWLIGFEGRVDGYRPLQSGDPQTALQLAILSGKRLYLGGLALDLTAGPGVAFRGIGSTSETVRVVMGAASPPPARSGSNSGSVPRLLVGARLGFSPHSVFRTFIGVDGEFGPAGSTEAPVDDVVSSQQIPSYTVGIAFGTTVGTL